MSDNYFDDDLLGDDQLNGGGAGEQEYDDDETFGDTGPLNDEWENQHMSLAVEHESFVVDNKLRDGVVNRNQEDDEEPNGHGDYDDDEEYDEQHYKSNGNNQNNNNNNNNNNARTVGKFSSLSLYDNEPSSNQVDDDQLESMFKIAMGENYKPPPTHIPSIPTPANSMNNVPIVSPSDPLKKLFQHSTPPTSSQAKDVPKGAYSLSDLEAKFESQSSSSPQQQSPLVDENGQPITPNKNYKQQPPQNGNRSSPSRPGFTLGDLIPGNKEYQNKQRELRDQAREANWSQHQSPRGENNNINSSSGLSPINSPTHNNNNNNRYKHQNGKSPMKYQQSTMDKKYMTAEEIQTIHRLQAYQLHYTNPYVEDFYYQKLKQKLGNSLPSHTHTPICDSLPKIVPKKPTTTTDPLLGALGRIPSHSIRAPRPILQIILDKDDNEQYDKTVQSSDQTIKLAIESSYNHLLDIEDIDQLINGPAAQATPTSLSEYQAKREAISQDLFKSLHLDPFPCFKFESPLLPQQTPDQKWPSVCPEDLLFVSLWVIGKGRKLLNRAFLSLNAQQSVSALFAVCRNLPLLLMLHLPEGSENATNGIYRTVARWIMEVPIPFFNLAFHFLVNFNQPQFLVKVFSHRNGMAIVEQFLMRGYLIQDQNYLAHNQITVDPVAILQWHEIFGRFFQRLSGNFSAIFRAPLNNPQPPPPELGVVHSLIFHHANENQKNILTLEMSRPI